MKSADKAYAIIRVASTVDETSIENNISVEEITYELSAAKVEVERLNATAGNDTKYFLKTTYINPKRLKPILQKEAKKHILKEWQEFRKEQEPTDMLMFGFFCKLLSTMPELTEFRTRGTDPWQIIHAWLLMFEDDVGDSRR